MTQHPTSQTDLSETDSSQTDLSQTDLSKTVPQTITSTDTRRSPSAGLLVGTAIGLSTGVQLAVYAIGMFVASNHDIHRSQGVGDP